MRSSISVNACSSSVAAAAHLAPEAVGAVVELDRGEQALVVDVALGEAAGSHRVVVLPRLRPPVLDAVLEGVVHQREEAQLLPSLAGLAPALDRREQVGHVRAHRALRMTAARLAPRQALLEHRILAQRALEVGLRREAGNRGEPLARQPASRRARRTSGRPRAPGPRRPRRRRRRRPRTARGPPRCPGGRPRAPGADRRSASRGGAPRARHARRTSIASRCQPRSVAAACARAASAERTASSHEPAWRRSRARVATKPSTRKSAITAATAISTIAKVEMASGAKVMRASV